MKLWNDKYPKSKYEIFGFYLEYFVDNKYMGSIDCEYEENRKPGYTGRKLETIEKNIITNSNKIIKAGTKVMTLYCLYYGAALNWNETHYDKEKL